MGRIWILSATLESLISGCNSDTFTALTPADTLSATLPAPIGATPTPSATQSPVSAVSPSVGNPGGSCTQSCSLANGVGVQDCGSSTAACSATLCNPGYLVQNGACVESGSSAAFQCASYQLLSLDGASGRLTPPAGGPIPPQDVSGSGVCFYYPINTLTLGGSSYLTGTDPEHHDGAIVARDHDVNGTSPTTVWNPYRLLRAQVGLFLGGARVVQLVGGGPNGDTFNMEAMAIDNFFLIGIYPASVGITASNAGSYYSAWGSGDSTVMDPISGSTNGILFNPNGINLTTNTLTTYAGGGTTPYSSTGVLTNSPYAVIPLNALSAIGVAQVPQVQCTNLITSDTLMSVDFRALDCGGGRSLNPIYLVVQ